MRKLTVDDISDLRAYERERDAFRSHVIGLKRRRRFALGPFLTIVFENTDTMRFQVQEMARAERMLTDAEIAYEVDTYNDLVPGDGELSGTLFVEITDAAALREWLPKLVGLQRHVHLEVAGERATAREVDEERLTRESELTSTVHYLRFALAPSQQAGFLAGPVRLVVDHPAYAAVVDLDADARAELARDLA